MKQTPLTRTQEPYTVSVLILGMHYAPETSGNAPYTTGMAQALAAAGHRVRVVTGYPHYPQWKIAEGYRGVRMTEHHGDVAVTRVRHPVPASPTAVRRVLMDAAFTAHTTMVRGPRPDVVIAVSPVLLTVAAGLSWRSPGRTALGVVIQDLYSRALVETGLGSGPMALAADWLEGRLLRRADGITVAHENFTNNLVQLGVDRERVSVIPNWSHVAASTADRISTRVRLGWGPDEVIVLHAGNMGAKQGLENVVEAARRADAAGERVRFVLLGDGNQRPRLELAAHGVRSVTFLAPLPEEQFEAALAAADVLALNEATSVVEMSVPSKLTSYFSSGRPVVAATAARSAAAKELERSGAGIRVDPGDPDALYRACLEIGADGARSTELGARGQDYAARYLTAEKAALSYNSWVRALAGSRAAFRHARSLPDRTRR
jgi:colanic acid biosynthesis glycosyl transferase WcaI